MPRRFGGSSEDCPAPGALPDLPDLPALPGSAVDCPIPAPETGSGSGSGNTLDVVTCAGSIKQGSYVASVKSTKRTLTLPPGFSLGAESTVVDDPDCSESGSGSGTPPVCDDLLLYETDVECVAGIRYVIRREITYRIVDGCLQRIAESDWYRTSQAGCCYCGSGSGSGSGSGDDIGTPCCEYPVAPVLYVTVTSTGECTGTGALVYRAIDPSEWPVPFGWPPYPSHAWEGQIPLRLGDYFVRIWIYCHPVTNAWTVSIAGTDITNSCYAGFGMSYTGSCGNPTDFVLNFTTSTCCDDGNQTYTVHITE